MVQNLFYGGFVALTLGAGLYVAIGQNLIRAAFGLFFALCGIAGLYVLLAGDFIAMIQLMVYAGGIAVLLAFGAMLTHKVDDPQHSNLLVNGFLSFVSGIAFFSLLFYVLTESTWRVKAEVLSEPTTKEIGKLLLKEYVLPFEVVSFLLLVAMIGAVYLVQKGDNQTQKGDHP